MLLLKLTLITIITMVMKITNNKYNCHILINSQLKLLILSLEILETKQVLEKHFYYHLLDLLILQVKLVSINLNSKELNLIIIIYNKPYSSLYQISLSILTFKNLTLSKISSLLINKQPIQLKVSETNQELSYREDNKSSESMIFLDFNAIKQ